MVDMTTRKPTEKLRQAKTAQARVERIEAQYREAVSRRDDLVRELGAGFSLREIAHELGVSHQAVAKMMKERKR